MNPTRRLALFALIFGFCLGVRPSVAHAQGSFPASNFDPRYATWDTTLVRDTLGLTFERLFPLADSLRRKPEDLKLLSATWRWSLGRLVKMADSLDQPIDSVGPIMDRERFNPLANVTTRTTMSYISVYAPSASGDDWHNTLNHTWIRGPIVSTNSVDIDQRQNGRGGLNGRTEVRTATSNLNWKFSPGFAVGANVSSTRNDNLTTSGLYARADRNDLFGMNTNVRPRAWMGLTPFLNANVSVNNVDQIGYQKRGWKLDGTGRLGYSSPWFSHDLALSGSTSNFNASPTDPDPLDELLYPNARTRESDTHLRGTLTALRGRPVELNVNYQIDNTRNHVLAPVNDSSFVFVSATPETILTPRTNSPLKRIASGSVNAALRIQPVPFGSMDLAWKAGNTSNENTTLIAGNNSGHNHSFTAGTRLELGAGITVQGNFSTTQAATRYPKRDFPRGGYAEDRQNHDLSGIASIPVGGLFTLSLDTDIQLTSLRYSRIATPRSLPLANDAASQYYKITISPPAIKQRMSNTIGFKAERRQQVNLAAASTAANINERLYTATWTWSYLLLPGLTANQTNSLLADYSSYPFSATSNNVQLNYSTTTTLDANVGPRFAIHTTHTAQFQPKGNSRPRIPDDPTEYLSLSDEFQNYSLNVRADYSLIAPFLTVYVNPIYSANSRSNAQSGELAPQRKSKTLNFQWGASVNIPVGSKGTLSGSLTRSENTSREIQFDTSGMHVRPRASTQSLYGNLTLTVNL